MNWSLARQQGYRTTRQSLRREGFQDKERAPPRRCTALPGEIARPAAKGGTIKSAADAVAVEVLAALRLCITRDNGSLYSARALFSRSSQGTHNARRLQRRG